MAKPKKKIGRPNRILYYLGFGVVRAYFRILVGTKFSFDRSGLADLKKGPALIIAPHISGLDHITVGIACQKYLPTFVLSEHLMAKPLIRFILTKFGHVITKKMFCADAGTIMGIMRAKAEGNVIVLFPEGRMNAVAHTFPVTQGTAELVKRLEIPVYCVTGNGAALADPKWSKGFRGGLIRVETSKVFSVDDIKELSVDQIDKRLSEVILHDDEKAMAGHRYRTKDTTSGLDGVLYKCPECGQEFTLKTEKGSVCCTSCGFKTELTDDYSFTSGSFSSINEWFYWQLDELDLDTVMEEDIKIGAVGAKGNMDLDAGSGHLYLDRYRLMLKGQVFGEEVDYSVELSSLGGTPYTPNKEFDIYYKKKLLYLQPQDPRSVVKWVTFIDKSVAESRGISLH